MPKHMGFQAHVTDENWNRLTEYKVETLDEEKLVTCYIPSSVNQVRVHLQAYLSSCLIYNSTSDSTSVRGVTTTWTTT